MREGSAIELEDASVQLAGRAVWGEVSISMARGEFVALLGANGSGKSTLLRVVLGALALHRGRVRVLGERAGARNAAIGYLPQRHSFEPGTRLRGVDIVRLGLDGDRWGLPLPLPGRAARSRRRSARERVARVIEDVGGGRYADRAIDELSGGEQQRLLIAQALVRDPELLLLDEPLDSLDLPNQAGVARLVNGICRQAGVGVLLVAHDVNPLLPYIDRVIYLAGGRAVEGTVEQVINAETLSRLHGVPVEVLRASDGRVVVVGQPDAPALHHDRHMQSSLAAQGHAH
ncbi:MAG: ATP-binding cassette domain-containing protein [Actinobacteria bacterium]|nr:MAG: ATP-binding cassette domain-containing protein [Actinomycetota bacterium]